METTRLGIVISGSVTMGVVGWALFVLGMHLEDFTLFARREYMTSFVVSWIIMAAGVAVGIVTTACDIEEGLIMQAVFVVVSAAPAGISFAKRENYNSVALLPPVIGMVITLIMFVCLLGRHYGE
jgi:hypothetical protein